MPEISVIVPVYKVEKHLKRCIDSVLNQSFADFELILVDDGSPDNCPIICDEYAKKENRVKVIHKSNGGVSSARNAGIKAATGKYITFADSDDSVESAWLNNMYNAFLPDVDMVASACNAVSEAGELITVFIPFNQGIITIDDNKRLAKIISLVFRKELIFNGVYTKLFKTEIIKDNTVCFCENCENFAEDMAFLIEYLLYCNTINCIDEAGYNYYQNTGSMMNKTEKMVMLNALNEASKHVSVHYINVFGNFKNFPILYWEMMFNQYIRMISDKAHLSNASEEIEKIMDRKWHKKWTGRIFLCYRKLVGIYGYAEANKILAYSNYFRHCNWKRYTYEEAILYKMMKFYKKHDERKQTDSKR